MHVEHYHFNCFCEFISVIVIFSLLSGCGDSGPVATADRTDVAVYTGPGAWDVSVTASLAALNAAGVSVGTIDTPELLSGGLDDFRVLLFPGGDPRDYSIGLGPVGRGRIRGFVASGGGFVGFGGGAAVADSDSGIWPGIGLFGGEARWPVERIASYPDYTITEVKLADPTHPIGRGGEENYWTLYRWGPEFIFPELRTETVQSPLLNTHIAKRCILARLQETDGPYYTIYLYAPTDTPAAIAFSYWAGEVFLCGFQPEIEENDARDGTDFGVELIDVDTEWDIIERAVRFCLWQL